jgi:5-methylcytosine-specific restriction protein A
VLLATGFPIPRGCGVVPEKVANQVWKAARGLPLIGVERAMEGATTEARSKYRNPQLRQAALQLANGACAACGIRDSEIHPQLGRHALVVHHKKQLKDSDQPRETKISDLAVVCANCHMMIHQDPAKALTIAQMRKRVVSPK